MDKKQSLVDMLGSKDYSRFCDDDNHINPRQSRFRGSLNDYMETLIILACEPHVNAASICNSLNLFMFNVDFSRNTLHKFLPNVIMLRLPNCLFLFNIKAIFIQFHVWTR